MKGKDGRCREAAGFNIGWGGGGEYWRGGGDGGGWGRGILSAYFTSQWGTCVPFQVDKGAVLAFFSLHPAGVIFNLNIRESSE